MADDLPLSALRIDPAERPALPEFPDVTPAQRQAGRHLAAIHRHYLDDLSRIAQVLARITAGDAQPSDLAHIVLHAEMAQNFRAFGTLCGRQCWALTMHHDIEEQAIFPALHSRGDAPMRQIVERLRAEHEVVHALLDRLGEAAQTLSDTPGDAAFTEASAIFTQLVEVVRSHFGFEETALAEALGVYGVQV